MLEVRCLMLEHFELEVIIWSSLVYTPGALSSMGCLCVHKKKKNVSLRPFVPCCRSCLCSYQWPQTGGYKFMLLFLPPVGTAFLQKPKEWEMGRFFWSSAASDPGVYMGSFAQNTPQLRVTGPPTKARSLLRWGKGSSGKEPL